MHNPEPQAAGEHAALTLRWRRLRAAYRYANRASHHVLGFTVKLGLLVYFAFMALFLFLRYAVLPNIDYYKPDIERVASRVLGNQVTISRLYASWNGLHPSLFLGDLSMHDKQGRLMLALPSVSATLSWWSVLAAEPRFQSLELIRPELDVRRTKDGALFVAGVRLDQAAPGTPGGPDWLFRQNEIVIRQGKLHWTDEARGAPELALSDVTLALTNNWTTHRFALKATPPAALGQPLDVRARFTHPGFGRPSDMARWKGELYADLRETDLAGWKQYFDYPFELKQGKGSVRAWLTLDHARLAAFTADVALAGVSARLGHDLPQMELARVAGRLSASEPPGAVAYGKPAFGANGYSVSVSDFSVATSEGTLLPPATVSQTWTPAAHGRPEQATLQVRQVDLAALAELARQLPLTPAVREMLADFAPRGQLQDVAARWEGRYPAIASYRVQGQVANLSIMPQPARAAQPAAAGVAAQPARAALPGFDNLTGSIDASEHGGSVHVDSSDLVLHMPAWFEQPSMALDKAAVQARWSYPQKDQLLVEVDGLHLEQGKLKVGLSGRHLLPLGPGKGPGRADFTGSVDGFDMGQLGRFLPLATPARLREWLGAAVQGGTLYDASLRLRGDLAHFPFRGDTAAARARGEFRVAGRIENATFEYAPQHRAADGKSPLWPLAEQINGSIVFDRARMEIHADTLRTQGVAATGVKAVIADLGAHELMLDIDGNAGGPLQEFLRYVAASPVLEWIGHVTEDTRATGNAKLALKLHIPLERLHDTTVQGALQLQGNDVALFPELPPLQASGGRVEFNERGFGLAGVAGNFLGAPLAVTGGTQRDGTIVVRMAGTLSADGMRRTASEPVLQRLGQHLSGSTRYTGSVVVKDRVHTVTLESTLAGLSMELPAPLNKPAADALPLRFVLSGGPATDAGLSHDEIRIGLGQGIASRYVREKQGHGPWLVKRGGIGVNVPAPEPDSGLMLNVNAKSLNLDQWIDLGRELGAGDARAPAAGADAGPGMAQFVMPDTLAARAAELVVDERKLADVVVGASHQKGGWQASIHSRQAVGYLTWDESPSGQGLGKVTARLASLIIPASAANEVKDLLASDKSSSATIPALDIVADRFELFNKQFGRLELAASNVTPATGREWRIDRLSLVNPDGQLRASGRWVVRDGTSNTSMNFNLDMHDAGKLLDRLGFPETLRHGKGKLSGDIAWSGLPYSLDIPTLSGRIALDVEDGQFLKQDPGAAKLLGVLSLQALPRLLKLDFHDVFAEGLAFDGITANATISRGVVKTDNLKMHGVSATVLMDGAADIANESTNLHVVVIPEFNLGTGPLVYGLAVNPVIGLGSFLAQLFLRAPVMKALTYQMQITGPWKSPTITRLDDNKTQPQEQANAKEKP